MTFGVIIGNMHEQKIAQFRLSPFPKEFLMKLYPFAIAIIWSLCAPAEAADTIAVQQSSPLAALTIELHRRYGYPVTYEEAPFDPAKLQIQQLPNGAQRNIPVTSAAFEMPPFKVGEAIPGAANRVPAGLPDVILPILAKYRGADGGSFSALFYGGYAHIIQTNRIVNGKSEPFEPILGTTVTINVQDVSCSTALNELLAQVNLARGVRVAKAILPTGPLMRHPCFLNFTNAPARDVLASILGQSGKAARPFPDTIYAWVLMYDATTDKYFLSTSIVPDLSTKPAHPATPPVTAPTGASAPNGPPRGVILVPKKP